MLVAIILFGNLVLAEEMAGVVESKANEIQTEGNALTTPGNETESTNLANNENETTIVTNDSTKSEAVSSNETGNSTNMEFGFESQQQKDENGDSAPSVIEKAKREVLSNEPEGFEASSLNETGKMSTCYSHLNQRNIKTKVRLFFKNTLKPQIVNSWEYQWKRP
jgi:hypothetical protein